MIIHKYKTTLQNDQLERSARIEWEHVNEDTYPWYHPPTNLIYRIPREYEQSLANNAHSFLIPMVPVAMFFSENIHVRGEVSQTLLYNLAEYQRVLCFWRPNWFSPIKITADNYTDATCSNRDRGVIGSYSGGIDSTYTLWSHLPEQETLPVKRLTHNVYIRGFDTVEDSDTQDIKTAAFAPFITSLNLEFVDISSNAMKFHALDEWTKIYMTFSSVLVGAMVQFEPIISHYYFSADNTHDFSLLSSINHHIVPLLSTDRMSMVVHGASVSKFEKIKTLTNWSAVHNKLVVCHDNPNGLKNCGTCLECCLITSTMQCAGVLDKFTTFPNKVCYRSIRTYLYPKEFLSFPKSVAHYAKESGQHRIRLNYLYVIYASLACHYVSIVFTYIYGRLYPLLHPMQTAYALSAKLKQHSSLYTQLIVRLKKER